MLTKIQSRILSKLFSNEKLERISDIPGHENIHRKLSTNFRRLSTKDCDLTKSGMLLLFIATNTGVTRTEVYNKFGWKKGYYSQYFSDGEDLGLFVSIRGKYHLTELGYSYLCGRGFDKNILRYLPNTQAECYLREDRRQATAKKHSSYNPSLPVVVLIKKAKKQQQQQQQPKKEAKMAKELTVEQKIKLINYYSSKIKELTDSLM